jgi:hypothetical protein
MNTAVSEHIIPFNKKRLQVSAKILATIRPDYKNKKGDIFLKCVSSFRQCFMVASLLGLGGSNTAGCIDVSLSRVLFIVKGKCLRRADPSSRGVVPAVFCLCVWSKQQKNEAALARAGLLGQKLTYTCSVNDIDFLKLIKIQYDLKFCKLIAIYVSRSVSFTLHVHFCF